MLWLAVVCFVFNCFFLIPLESAGADPSEPEIKPLYQQFPMIPAEIIQPISAPTCKTPIESEPNPSSPAGNPVKRASTRYRHAVRVGIIDGMFDRNLFYFSPIKRSPEEFLPAYNAKGDDKENKIKAMDQHINRVSELTEKLIQLKAQGRLVERQLQRELVLQAQHNQARPV